MLVIHEQGISAEVSINIVPN
uniref:Uncharacterized protein n=1 Tax=Rhizophora mucronata TaxID=61149 RepID=A0A2P2IUL6_RHIMU